MTCKTVVIHEALCPRQALAFSCHTTQSVLVGLWLLLTLLMMSSGPAYGEWMDIAYTEGPEGYTLYVDPATIRRKENLVKMWVLYDYKLVQRVGRSQLLYLSDRTQQQFDCAEERARRLAYTTFSLNMAKGNVVTNDADEGTWQPVAPGTIGLAMWNVACCQK